MTRMGIITVRGAGPDSTRSYRFTGGHLVLGWSEMF